jgi:SWI/SNF-related matrix-associated actin-dependent regulator of chromatin subfamily A member 5
LSESERAPFEKLAKADKARYIEECRVRDEEVLAEQEERRRNNQMTSTDTRMRNSTLSNTEAMAIKEAVPKRKRELTEKEVNDKRERDDSKKKVNAAEAKQKDSIAATKAAQAEARLKFLLSQSDLFSHFGGKEKKPPSGLPLTSTDAAGTAPRRAAGESNQNLKDLDADEVAMLEDGDETQSLVPKATTLLKQPSIISGGEMRSYQLEGLNWMIRLMENGINGILADEMGLGKTLQSISIVAYMNQYLNQKGPHLIMVPKSTLSNWMNEFNRFCPSIRTLRFHGTKEERDEIINDRLKNAKAASENERDWDVLITTYEVVNLEKHILTKIHWTYLIIDEAHRLKNEASMFSQTVRLLQTKYRLLLTGTPLQNNLHELWALLNFLLPDVFSSSEQFDDWFNLDVDDTEAKQRIIGQLHKLLRPFMLRRLKADVETSLPPKSETILFVGMSTMQKKLYKDILMRDIDTINGTTPGSDSKNSRTAVLNIVMQLRKACNHPYLFPGLEDRALDPHGEHLYANCGKMVLLHKLLIKLKLRGHRVLLFSQMTKMIDIFEDYFISQGYKYCRIDGNTSYEEREDGIANYNRPGSDKFIFVLSTRAGGLGINLQTADTVILYDSDWNPQADLQAQDRAHRIGQKKPVQIYRLVTDDTVEVKVVERAQQKLKLDAMVVQQGRLQDKEKKLTTDDLMESIRFGADKIFKSKDSAISDEDIDTILEAGHKRTLEMNSKLEAATKGDLYDFRLDGGMKTQEFDGVDYSDRNTREELSALAMAAYIDPGKRERKVVASYSESVRALAPTGDEVDKKARLPRHLRLPKMDDWQFYNKARLEELHDLENKMWEECIEKGENPLAGLPASSFVMLPVELHAEKERLLSEGFKDWTKSTFSHFCKHSSKFGRSEYEKIGRELQVSADEVERYAKVFWERGAHFLGEEEYSQKVKLIEKGEKHLEEIQRLSNATSKLISCFDDPWEELTFKHSGSANRIFNAAEDRFLLCLTHMHGHGSWNRIRSSLQRSDRFRFDSYLQSCSEEALGKRCELLMRSAERELAEIERKQSDSLVLNKAKDQVDIEKGKVLSATQQDIAKKIANIRMQMRNIKDGGKSAPGSKGLKTESGAVGSKLPLGTKKAKPTLSSSIAAVASMSSSVSAAKIAGGKNGIPDAVIPELCKYVLANATLGLEAFKTGFISIHPEIAKRQVEIKIQEIFVKSGKAYVFREGFEHLLNGPPTDSSKKAKAGASNGSSAGQKRERDPNAVSVPRRPKVHTAMTVFVKEQRGVIEKSLITNTDYNQAAAEDKKLRLKEAISASFEALTEEATGSYESKAKALNQALLEEYNTAMAAYNESQSKTSSVESIAKKVKTENNAEENELGDEMIA